MRLFIVMMMMVMVFGERAGKYFGEIQARFLVCGEGEGGKEKSRHFLPQTRQNIYACSSAQVMIKY